MHDASMHIVIVGNGIAGNEVASNLRRLGSDCRITCLSAESVPEYDPCSLTYFVGKDVEREVVFRKKAEDYCGERIEIHFNEEVVAVDAMNREVVTRNEKRFSYDKLVLAHGGNLFVPRIPGVDLPSVFACKSLGDADALANHDGVRAVVIGSGAIGIEVAEALKKRGYEVAIIELCDRVLPTLFDKPAARILEESLRANDIHVYTGERVERIEGEGKAKRVVTGKRKLDCDTVVLATGVAPGCGLAKSSGIEVGRGIKVDAKMRTSVKDIFACGDCVETFDMVTGEPCVCLLKHNSIEQGRIAAENILGRETVYRGAYSFARVHFFDTHAVTFGSTENGLADCTSMEIIERTQNGYLRLILKDGKLLGGQAVGKAADQAGLFMGAMMRGDDFNEIRSKWPKIRRFGSCWPWRYRAIARALGLPFLD